MNLICKNTLYTIGHSTRHINEFIDILNIYNINCVVDVRSVPYSKYTPQFNKNNIMSELNNNNIQYIDFSKEFGARRVNEKMYTDNKVDFTKVSKSVDFINGLNRIKTGINKGFNIVLMCSEKDPKKCHRSILISRHIQNEICNVIHIIDNDLSINHYRLCSELIEETKSLNDNEMYLKMNRKIGYKRKD